MSKHVAAVALAAVLAFAIALALVVYLYSPEGLNPFIRVNTIQNNTTPTQSANSIALSSFLNNYGFLNITNLAAFYQIPTNNEIVLNCNVGIIPEYLYNIPFYIISANHSAYSGYNYMVSEVGLLTMCNFDNNLAGCSSVNNILYNFSVAHLNYTTIYELYNQTKQFVLGDYESVANFTGGNSSYFSPIFDDKALLSSTNVSFKGMIKSLIDLKALPGLVLDFSNGTVYGVTNEFIGIPANQSISNAMADEFYVPFQFPTVLYPFMTPCNSSLHVFNFISDTSAFKTKTYSDIYSNLSAKITNICVASSSNSCNQTIDRNLNVSFYV
jgi:hypothetical protein